MKKKINPFFTGYLMLFIFFFYSCTHYNHLIGTKNIYYQSQIVTTFPDEKYDSLIAPYKTKLSAKMDGIVAFTEIELLKKKPEGSLGNWFCDMVKSFGDSLSEIPIAFAAQNYGGLRIGTIPKGSITRGKIFELMPFENNLVFVDLTGEKVQAFADHIMKSGGWPLSKGIVIINKGIQNVVTINGESLISDKLYRVALPDYVANGGDRSFFLKGQKQTITGVLLRDVVFMYLENHKGENINNESQFLGRVKIE